MGTDDQFEPKLGKIGSRRAPRLRGFLQRVLNTAGLAGAHGRSRSQFKGNRIGRGAGVGRVLSARDRFAAFRSRRVVVKSRVVKLAGKGLDAARAHLRYLQRDGVTHEGTPGELYDGERDRVDGRTFLEQGKEDRHQFRFIVSAEDAAAYEDLKPFVRRLMTQVEKDLGTKLEWVAVNHHNTGHPHSHIVVRGRDDRGRDLIIARDYVSHGLRERAAELVTFDLGPRSDSEIETRLRKEVEQERFTSVDRKLLKEVGEDGLVRSGQARGDTLTQSLRAGRLQKLKRLGLAQEVRAGQWRLKADLERVLRRMGERGDIVRTMHRELAQRGLNQSSVAYAIYDPADQRAEPIVGRVTAHGLSDELNDRRFLMVDGTDGRTHYVDIGKGDPVKEGGIVAVVPKRGGARAVDRTVAEVAAAHGGRYSVDLHLKHDPSATAAFAEAHVRRLEAMRRLSHAVERETDGTWIIAPDHIEKAAAFEKKLARFAPVAIEVLSRHPLEQQIAADGATWLDRELTAQSPLAPRDLGFGREVHDALERRRQWLMEQDLAKEEAGQTVYRVNLLTILKRRDLNRAAGQLSQELGLDYSEARVGDRVDGIYRRSVDLVSGRFAVIQNAREFTLVPWRPVMERNRGRQVDGIMGRDAVSWTLGRQRSGPTIG